MVGYLSSNVTQSSISTWYPLIKTKFQSAKLGICTGLDHAFIMMGIAAGNGME